MSKIYSKTVKPSFFTLYNSMNKADVTGGYLLISLGLKNNPRLVLS